MLPRSCLRWADSKSNSSTRLPRTTTTRVSSGWVASISILLGIWELLEAARREQPVAAGAVGLFHGPPDSGVMGRPKRASMPEALRRRSAAADDARRLVHLTVRGLVGK